jgi:hypothetical protein
MKCIICSDDVSRRYHDGFYYKNGIQCEKVYLSCRSNIQPWCGYLQLSVRYEPDYSIISYYCLPLIYRDNITLIKGFSNSIRPNETSWWDNKLNLIMQIPFVPIELSNFNEDAEKIINKFKIMMLFS